MHNPLTFSTHSHVFYKHDYRTRLILLVAQTLRLILKDGSDVYLLLSNSRFTSERPGERSSPARGAVSLSCFERPPQAARGTADRRIPAHASDFIHRASDQQPFQKQGDHLLFFLLLFQRKIVGEMHFSTLLLKQSNQNELNLNNDCFRVMLFK